MLVVFRSVFLSFYQPACSFGIGQFGYIDRLGIPFGDEDEFWISESQRQAFTTRVGRTVKPTVGTDFDCLNRTQLLAPTHLKASLFQGCAKGFISIERSFQFHRSISSDHPRCVDGDLNIHFGIDEIAEYVQGYSDDGGSAGGPQNEARLTVLQNDGGRHAGAGSLSTQRFRVVSECGASSAYFARRGIREEMPVVGTIRYIEIGEFIVQQKPSARNDDSAAEVLFDRRRNGDSVPIMIYDGEVSRAFRLFAERGREREFAHALG